MFIIMWSVLGILFLIYCAVAVCISIDGFDKAKIISQKKEKELLLEWYNHTNRYSRREAEPNVTLRDFYLYGQDNYAAAALKARAFRRMVVSPVWPLLLIADGWKSYQEAKAGERIYRLEQSTKALKDSQKYQQNLAKAQEEAEEVISLVKSGV